jgi:NAD/NADP transhydrogenase alpha subunit
MNESTPEVTPESTPNRHLGFRIAVGVVGLVLIALFIMLGTVASKQSDTRQALETHESLQAAPAPAQPKGNP